MAGLSFKPGLFRIWTGSFRIAIPREGKMGHALERFDLAFHEMHRANFEFQDESNSAAVPQSMDPARTVGVFPSQRIENRMHLTPKDELSANAIKLHTNNERTGWNRTL